MNGLAQSIGPYAGVGSKLFSAGVTTPGIKYIATIGSILVLDFASVIN